MKYNPKVLIADQTLRCNQECWFCWRSDKGKVRSAVQRSENMTMPMDVLREILKQGQQNGLSELSYCGPMGDPLTVRDISERGRMAKLLGFRTSINTNGAALHKHDPAELLSAFDEVSVSLDALTGKTHRDIHGKDGQFDGICEQIERLIKTDPHRTHVRFTMNAKNQEEWPEFLRRYLGRCWIKHKKLHSFVDVRTGETELREPENCNQPKGCVNYTVNGDMTTCCINYKMEPTFGHIFDGMKNAWESDAFEEWRANRVQGICGGCSGLGGNDYATYRPL